MGRPMLRYPFYKFVYRYLIVFFLLYLLVVSSYCIFLLYFLTVFSYCIVRREGRRKEGRKEGGKEGRKEGVGFTLKSNNPNQTGGEKTKKLTTKKATTIYM